MLRHRLTDEQWHLIRDFFPPYVFGRPPCDRRTVVDGILWILRTGSPWRDLPDQFGPWQTVWRLFDRWDGDGTLDAILNQLRATAADAGEEDVPAPVESGGDSSLRYPTFRLSTTFS